MDALLCDELLVEIFQRLSLSSASAVSLVSKRWLRLYRYSTTSLSLRFTPHTSSTPSLSALLSHYPFLSSLSLLPHGTSASDGDCSASSSHLLLKNVVSSCSNLSRLRFLAAPVPVFSLLSLSASCNRLTSLTISLARPLSFLFILYFPFLKELSVFIPTGGSDKVVAGEFDFDDGVDDSCTELALQSLSLSGTVSSDRALDWLWRSSRNLQKLKLRSCEGIGEGGSFASFVKCLQGLKEVELRTCRSIVDGVLLRLAENCTSLTSLLVYDGGSTEGLLRFIIHSSCNLQRLDLRLPLDLNNDHLSAVAEKFRNLSILRLQSCCLVTGEGLKYLGTAVSGRLEELALINCDVVEREPGLLTFLGQNLKQLKKLDISHNEMLIDKEFVSMIVSCNYLTDLNLRGCRRLTSTSMVSLFKSCKHLQNVDVINCQGIGTEAVELFVLNSPRLRKLQVEESKISGAARSWASHKFIEVVL